MTVSDEIDRFIAENGGNARDALNVALARLDLYRHTIETARSLNNEIAEELPKLREDILCLMAERDSIKTKLETATLERDYRPRMDVYETLLGDRDRLASATRCAKTGQRTARSR